MKSGLLETERPIDPMLFLFPSVPSQVPGHVAYVNSQADLEDGVNILIPSRTTISLDNRAEKQRKRPTRRDRAGRSEHPSKQEKQSSPVELSSVISSSWLLSSSSHHEKYQLLITHRGNIAVASLNRREPA